MADQLKSVTVQAPGFLGLNTQEAALVTKEGWCLDAQNCVFDNNGRLAARNGYSLVHSTATYSSNDIVSIGEWIIDGGAQDIFVADSGGNIYKGVNPNTAVDETGSVAANDGHWQWINYKDNIIGVRQDEVPIFWASGSTDMAVISGAASYGAVGSGDLSGNCALAAFGRCWIMDSDKQTIHISQTLDLDFGAADSYELDVSSVWPTGDDHVTALAAFQGRLVVFGEHNILIYANPDDLNGTSFDAVAGASTFQLEDTVSGIGCIARDSVQQIGEDIWFLSHTGVRSLARSLQTEVLPLTDVSFHNRSTLLDQVDNLNDFKTIKSAYSPVDGFYIITIPSGSGTSLVNNTWYFDTKKTLENSSRRMSKWTNIPMSSMLFASNDTLYFGLSSGRTASYTGYQDNDSAYRMSYLSSWTDFDSTSIKIPKRMRLTVTGGYSYTVNMKWAFDFSDLFTTSNRSLELQAQNDPDEWNVDEWGAQTHASFLVTGNQWVAETAYALNDIVVPASDNGYFYVCTTAGTSKTGAEPTWDTSSPSGTTSDGTVTWTTRAIATEVAEWSGAGSGNLVNTLSTPMKKSGQHLQYGFTVNIDGSAFAVQRIDVYAKIGRLNR